MDDSVDLQAHNEYSLIVSGFTPMRSRMRTKLSVPPLIWFSQPQNHGFCQISATLRSSIHDQQIHTTAMLIISINLHISHIMITDQICRDISPERIIPDHLYHVRIAKYADSVSKLTAGRSIVFVNQHVARQRQNANLRRHEVREQCDRIGRARFVSHITPATR